MLVEASCLTYMNWFHWKVTFMISQHHSSLSQITNAADSEAVTYRKLVKGHAYSVTGADFVRKKTILSVLFVFLLLSV